MTGKSYSAKLAPDETLIRALRDKHGLEFETGGGNISGLASIALPGRKLATSKNPRMLTPSEIDLLRQDLKMALTVIGPDEIEDAQRLIIDQGLRSDDFEISQHADASSDFPSPVTGTVTVTCKRTHISKTYAAGHNSRWLQLLEADLHSGEFDSSADRGATQIAGARAASSVHVSPKRESDGASNF